VPTSRIEAFSDGVFAIAITLLILEIQVPQGAGNDLWHALWQLWPNYAAYLVSFMTIGIIWVNHHAQFVRIVRSDRALLFWNLNLLLWVSFLPFPTAVLARYLDSGSGETAASAFYAGVLLVMSLSFYGVWRHAERAGLLTEELSPGQRRVLRRRNVFGHLAYALAVVLAFVSPAATLVLCAGVALFYVHPGRSSAALAEGS
jgi:uncharacterized membrane protein